MRDERWCCGSRFPPQRELPQSGLILSFQGISCTCSLCLSRSSASYQYFINVVTSSDRIWSFLCLDSCCDCDRQHYIYTTSAFIDTCVTFSSLLLQLTTSGKHYWLSFLFSSKVTHTNECLIFLYFGDSVPLL